MIDLKTELAAIAARERLCLISPAQAAEEWVAVLTHLRDSPEAAGHPGPVRP